MRKHSLKDDNADDVFLDIPEIDTLVITWKWNITSFVRIFSPPIELFIH